MTDTNEARDALTTVGLALTRLENERDALTAEVERLRGERDEALCSWESEAADNASLRSEVERLKGALHAESVQTNRLVKRCNELGRERDEARDQRDAHLGGLKAVDEALKLAGFDVFPLNVGVTKLAAERDKLKTALRSAQELLCSGPPVSEEHANDLASAHHDLTAWIDSILAPAPEPEEPAPTELMGECPACGEPAPTSEFGVVEHMDGCGWCGHPSSDGDGQGGYVCLICDTTIAKPAGEAGDEGAGESGQTPGSAGADGDPRPADSGSEPEPAPATPTTPTVTTIDARSRIAIEVHGECVVQPGLGPRNERTVFVRRNDQVMFTVPSGIALHGSVNDEPNDWSKPSSSGVSLPPGDRTYYLWTSDPAIDVTQNKDLKYPPDACVLHVRVVPVGEEMPTFGMAMSVIGSTPHPADPAFFDPDAIIDAVRDDTEAKRQVALIGSYGNDTLHWRRHQERFAGTGFAGLRYDPNEDDLRKRFTDGNCGWDALGDAVLIHLSDDGRPMQWDQGKEDVMKILRSKLIDNPLCQTPFGLVGQDWNKPHPFRHWYGRAAYRSFVDVMDIGLTYSLLQTSRLLPAVLSPMDEAHVRENFRRFAAFVEADMAVSDPRMWRTANVLAVECLRHLFPSLGLPDLSGYLTRWDGDVTAKANSVLTPEDPPRWLDKGDYTAHHMMGVCYSVYWWIAQDLSPPHIWDALDIWSGSRNPGWMWAKKTGTPQDGQDHRCARFTNSLTELWFPTNRDAVSLGSQDHALYVVASARAGGAL